MNADRELNLLPYGLLEKHMLEEEKKGGGRKASEGSK